MSRKRVLLGDKPGPCAVAESWVKAGKAGGDRVSTNSLTARLTIDVTPELRGRIKIIAFERGVTVAEMLRQLLEREYPSGRGAR